jgi:aspartate aminotransferase
MASLNLNVRGLPQSATLAINERSAQLQAEGRPVFRLGLGQSPFPVPEPVTEALRSNAHQKDYLPVKGLPALRQAVANYHSRATGHDYDGDGVLIGPGSKELMFILQLTYYGDLVIPTPSWVSYAPQAQIIGRQIRWVPTRRDQGWRMTAEALESLCRKDPQRPRLLILNFPNNPSGMSAARPALRKLATVARRYGVLLLSDEIYGETQFDGGHLSIASYYPEGTIISSGLSKWCGAGGWRLGTFTFPPALHWLLEAMAVVASETFTSVSAPIQYAAVSAFQGGPEIVSYLHHSRRILRAVGSHFARRLRDAGVQVEDPEGGFYLFPDFESKRRTLAEAGIVDSAGMCERLLQDTGVAILPGSAFGRPSDELTARLAYVDFDGARALRAAAELPPDQALGEDFLRQCCPRVVEAAERMAAWLDRPASGR